MCEHHRQPLNNMKPWKGRQWTCWMRLFSWCRQRLKINQKSMMSTMLNNQKCFFSMICRAFLVSSTGSTSAASPPAWTRSTPTFGQSVMVPGLAWWPTMITTGQVFLLSFDRLFIFLTENDTWGSCLGTGHCHQYHEQNLTIQDYHSVGWHYMLTWQVFIY